MLLRQKNSTMSISVCVPRRPYSGFPITDEHVIDTELVSNVIFRLHSGKAADNITGLTVEHLTHCHPSLSLVLCRLFKLIVQHKYVPSGFRHSYIVPVPKITDCRAKSMTCHDFRGIAVSPIISKVPYSNIVSWKNLISF